MTTATRRCRWGLLLPHRGYGRCAHCARPWWACQLREVSYTSSAGQFALCTRCWDRATPAERLAAHRALTDQWPDGAKVWPDIRRAVLADSWPDR